MVLVSKSLLLTAGLSVGDTAHVFPLFGVGSNRLPPGLPSLRQAQEAGTIRLKEDLTANIIPVTESSSREHKDRDWLDLALRELLGQLFILF